MPHSQRSNAKGGRVKENKNNPKVLTMQNCAGKGEGWHDNY